MSRDLVLLHGWGLSSSVWKPLAAALSGTFTLHTPNLPGHGTAAPARPSLNEWADALLSRIPEDAVLVGWSLGAQLALHLARQNPERVARLVLIGASPRFVQADDWPAALPGATLSAFRQDFDTTPDATQRRFVALQSFGDSARKAVAATLTDSLTSADEHHKAALADGLRLLAEADLRALIPDVRQPVRLLHGSEDKLMPVAAAEWLADTLPDARLTVFGQCGHAPFLSRPEECATLIEGFVLD
ncbi:alpha/beta fold hydrolase [Zoogloea sp.]|uniref:alpha/beta fold hydrolase n=1 Tax=Zoogloea sp. TaxID=49181 RepID=UPI0035AF6D1C